MSGRNVLAEPSCSRREPSTRGSTPTHSRTTRALKRAVDRVVDRLCRGPVPREARSDGRVAASRHADYSRSATVHVTWRTFGATNAILVSNSTTVGATFQSDPMEILAPDQMQRFNQPTPSTTHIMAALIQPRSLAVATIALPGSGRCSLRGTKGGNLTACPESACGRPQEDGSPRIALLKSTNHSSPWISYPDPHEARSI